MSSCVGSNHLNGNGLLSLNDVSCTAYIKRYNALPSIEEADQQIQSSPHFNTFLKEAEEIIVRYKLESHVGLRLLHRHFTVSEDKIMSETYKKVQGIPSLVTFACTLKEAQEKKALPSSWILKDTNTEGPQMFEASSDPAVRDGIKLIAAQPALMEEMANLLTSYNLNSLLSLAILKRSVLGPGHDDQHLLEISDSSTNESIVQLWDIHKSPQNIIRTSWSFKGPHQQRCWLSSVCEKTLLGHFSSTKHNRSK